MKDEKPVNCTHPNEENCFWCELSADGFDCQKNSFFIDLCELLEEPEMILEEIEELEMVLEETD